MKLGNLNQSEMEYINSRVSQMIECQTARFDWEANVRSQSNDFDLVEAMDEVEQMRRKIMDVLIDMRGLFKRGMPYVPFSVVQDYNTSYAGFVSRIDNIYKTQT